MNFNAPLDKKTAIFVAVFVFLSFLWAIAGFITILHIFKVF